ncbi:MAG: hypothetical protein ACFFAS_19015 [Promethearchaeota archaeon]
MPNKSASFDLNHIINEIDTGIIKESQLNGIIKVLYCINQEIVVSKKGLSIKLKLPKEEIDAVFEYLTQNGFLEVMTVNEVEIYSLSDKTKKDFSVVLKDLDANEQVGGILKTIEGNGTGVGSSEEKKPSLVGCFIADKGGKTLLTFELFDGALEECVKGQAEDLNPDFDIELIPMFVSALEKFSQNINMQELSELHMTGINLKLQTFSYEKYTVTFFINPEIRIESIKDKIKDYFSVLFNKYKEDFELTLKTGIIDNISYLKKLGREMLKELNKYLYLVEFKNIVINLDKYDQTHAKTLYGKLNQLYTDCQLKFFLTLEKIKKLKLYLLKTMFDEDLHELRDIINKTQEINSKLNLI